MRSVLIAASLLAVVTALPASAETMNFNATLSPKSEVPPHDALKGAGTVHATLDTTAMKLTYKVTYEGLTGKATMAHFHGAAPVGKNAGVMVPVSGSVESPIEGTATLTAEQVKALEGGDMYFNVHTEANKGGEIRGQLEKGM